MSILIGTHFASCPPNDFSYPLLLITRMFRFGQALTFYGHIQT